MYRTHANVSENSNLAIHCLLLQIEASMLRRGGKLPDTLFFQFDGGSENANGYMLAICELLVSLRLTKRIYLNRLLVRHTHEGELNFHIYNSLF